MSSEDEKNEYFRYLHSFEQAAANMRPITSLLGSYMNSLVENGFSRTEALQLVLRLQEMILASAWDIRGKKSDE